MVIKKTAIFILIILLGFSLSACKSPGEMAAEKVAEEMVEEATGVDADIDGDKITIEGEDGKMTIGETEWPSDGMAKEIPQVKSGVVYYVMNSEEICSIMVREVKENGFKDYLEDLKDAGFTSEKTEYSDETTSAYSARNDKGISITLTYSHESEEISIAASKEAQ